MGDVVKIMDRVCVQMASNGEEQALDLNNVTLRISMDVTGIVGFNKDFQTTNNFHDAETDATIENLKAGQHPCCLAHSLCAVHEAQSCLCCTKGLWLTACFDIAAWVARVPAEGLLCCSHVGALQTGLQPCEMAQHL